MFCWSRVKKHRDRYQFCYRCVAGCSTWHRRGAGLLLVWTQALHCLAFLVAMNLLLLSGVASTLSPDATGLTILTLLALGTFVAGVHIQAWQICVLGMVMGLGVPAIAWIERSALVLLLVVVALAAIGAALWWGARGKRA